MPINFRPLAALAVSTCLTLPAFADEGMWTFDAFPAARVAAAYGTAPDQAWLDRVRLSAARLTGGCSSSFVSGQGLLLTNHHCVRECAQANSTAEADLAAQGFVAARLEDERKCPGQQAEIVTAITDVTARVQTAIGGATGLELAKRRDATIAGIEKEDCTDPTTQRCQVVTLFGGGQYKLYRYRKYSDVRLVYAPEADAAFFGGDPDNFNFPRYDLDAAFLRAYENGRPAATPIHLAWAARAPKDGELIFVVGNPGTTDRLYTQAQLALGRDQAIPTTMLYMAELRGRLIAAMSGNAEKTRTGDDQLFGIENSYKVYFGEEQALHDPAFAAKLAAAEQDLRGKVAADPALAARIGDPWAEIARAQDSYRDEFDRYFFLSTATFAAGDLFSDARRIVRSAIEREKPNAARLIAYTDARLPLLQKQLTDPEPIYPWREELDLAYWLAKTRERLTTDAPEVKRLLGRESPEALAHRLVSGTHLDDPELRAALFKGGMAAVRASTDPMIRFALAAEPDARAALDSYRARVEGPVAAASARIAQARFAVFGTNLYPDATFTLRISYGGVKGWTYRGTTVPSTTTFSGLAERATGFDPYKLPPKELAALPRLDGRKVFDFVTDNDIVGGNSGSPIVAADGTVIGAAFDGNIHSLGGTFGFDPALNRTVGVSTVAVEEALTKIYPAPRLLAELHDAP